MPRSVRDHAADTPGGFVAYMALSALDRSLAEYELTPDLGPSGDGRDVGLSIGAEAFRQLGRPGELIIQIGSRDHYERMLADEQAAATEAADQARLSAADVEVAVDGGDPPEGSAWVILFKASGKYYTAESWRIPTELTDEQRAAGAKPGDLAVPVAMRWSPDFRRIDNGAVLVPTQEPWGFPALIMP